LGGGKGHAELRYGSDKKRTLGRPRHRREDNIIMDLLEVEWWAGTGLRDNWQAIVNVVMNLQVP
jgi:hypothetical protein